MKKKSKLELWIAFGAIALLYITVLVLEETMNALAEAGADVSAERFQTP